MAAAESALGGRSATTLGLYNPHAGRHLSDSYNLLHVTWLLKDHYTKLVGKNIKTILEESII